MAKDNAYNHLKERGLITHEGGGSLSEILSSPRKVYLGIDPSADSLHVGNLVPIILMKHLFNQGHEPFLLVGGATGMIGDPRESGERPLLEEEIVQKNTIAIKKQLSSILEKDGLEVFDNTMWLNKLTLVEFLREVGKNFTVNNLIKRDIIKRRLETEEDSISYTEFSYSLLQAYDFMYLHQEYDINLQVGGSDQWANIISGVDLIRRKKGVSAYALTTPIVIDKVTGKKFGKSEGNAVWLDANKTSPFNFYQFWLNVSDENVEEYLYIFSFLSLTEIADVVSNHNLSPQKRIAQKILAREVTTFVHGAEIVKSLERVSAILYGSEKVQDISSEEKELMLQEVPNKSANAENLKAGIKIVDALVDIDLAKSKAEARRLISGGGVKVNDEVIEAQDAVLTESDIRNGLIFIKKGKTFALYRVH